MADPDGRVSAIYKQIARRCAVRFAESQKDMTSKFPNIVVRNTLGRMRSSWLSVLLLLPFSVSIAFAQARAPGAVFRDCPACPDMVVVPPGEYKSLQGGWVERIIPIPGENPYRVVSISYALAIGRFEITRGQFAAFLHATDYKPGTRKNCFYVTRDKRNWTGDDKSKNLWAPGFAQTDEHPVVCISWHDAKACADWIARESGKHYRLLSEAEWDYAARAGTDMYRRWWGDSVFDACRYANVWDQTFQRSFRSLGEAYGGLGCSDGYVYTAPVGKFAENRFGLFDMIGNVAEWVEDCMNLTLEGAPADGSAWHAGNCALRILRGGSWESGASEARSALRSFRLATYRSNNLGFRVARTL